jgi:hypothetical protein
MKELEKPAEKPRLHDPAPEVIERADVRVQASPTRCPYCHSDISTSTVDWVVCKSCLARHHGACWRESSACASCGEKAHLTLPPGDPKARELQELLSQLSRLHLDWLEQQPTPAQVKRRFRLSNTLIYLGLAGYFLSYFAPQTLQGKADLMNLSIVVELCGVALVIFGNRLPWGRARTQAKARIAYEQETARIKARIAELRGG